MLQRTSGVFQSLNDFDARVLMFCVGVKSLEQHAAFVWAAGITADPRAVATSIARLLEGGLLVRMKTLTARGEQVIRHISTVVVLTADRPSHLERCLTSVALMCGRSAAPPAIVVIDSGHYSSRDVTSKTFAALGAC